jgi:hypothetical protein
MDDACFGGRLLARFSFISNLLLIPLLEIEQQEDGDGGAGRHLEVAAGAENGVGEQCGEGRVQPGLRRYAAVGDYAGSADVSWSQLCAAI